MSYLRAACGCLAVLVFAHFLEGTARAGDECPEAELVFDGPAPESFVVPEGCHFMLVKLWGNGGNGGQPGSPGRGNGGGGAAVTAIFAVESLHPFYARVIDNLTVNQWAGGRAAGLHDLQSGSVLMVAAGGGAGGAKMTLDGLPAHGGAGGGTAGQDGLPSAVNGHVLFAGRGGSEQGGGGTGGNGHPPNPPSNHGRPGGAYPCDSQGDLNCGQGGTPLGGNGGLGYFGGGGGGGTDTSGVDAGAGGGGGASFVADDPRLLYQRRYDGDRHVPGNPDDPDRHGAGQGGATQGSGTSFYPGATGRMVVRFNALEIVPELTTRWKPMRADDEPMDVVFDSPVGLESATLEIKDPDGVTFEASVGPLELLSSKALYRYKLPWTGPWTSTVGGHEVHLPPGNYSLTVRAPLEDFVMSSPEYGPVSLVEVTSVVLEAISPGTLSLNPELRAIAGQVPSQARRYLDQESNFQGGVRIFAESLTPSGQPRKSVTVRVTVSPAVPDQTPSGGADEGRPLTVTLRSFDVDDPASGSNNFADLDLDATLNVQDNRGFPPCGILPGGGTNCSIEIAVPLGETTVSTTLEVSGQPGDNYRVAASTSSGWLGGLFAVQPSNFGEIRMEDRSSIGTPLDNAGRKCVSEMLTVWRTLHLELDTTLPPPTSDTESERNFIRGDVIRIRAGVVEVGGNILTLRPQATTLPLGLDDGSPNLNHGMGFGRFELGTVEFGTNPLPFDIDANGDTEVLRGGGFEIPFRLFEPGGGSIDGFILRWDEASQQFEASILIPLQYDGGILHIAGMSWSGVSVSGPFITLSPWIDNPSLAFHLVDDDEAVPMAPVSNLLTPGAQAPRDNILLQAYIDVVHLPSGAKTAPFVRNIAEQQHPLAAQLCQGRDATTIHVASHWSGYVQGGFQGTAYSANEDLGDNDPGGESDVALGAAPEQLTSAVVFLETIRDVAAAPHGPPGASCPYGPTCPFATAVSVTTAHEVGHILGVPDGDGAIMSEQCRCTTTPFFSAQSLARIRWSTGPASPTDCIIDAAVEIDHAAGRSDITPRSEER